MNRKIVLGLLSRVHIGTAGDLLSTLARDRASRAKMRLGLLNALHGGWVDVPRGGVDERLATIPEPAWVDELEPMVPLIVESLKGAQDALRELEREAIGCGDADLVEGVDRAVSDLRVTLSGVQLPGAILTDDPDRVRRVSQWALDERRRLLARWKAGLPDAGANAEGNGQAGAAGDGNAETMPALTPAQWAYLQALAEADGAKHGADLAQRAGYEDWKRPLRELVRRGYAVKPSDRGGYRIIDPGRKALGMRP